MYVVDQVLKPGGELPGGSYIGPIGIVCGFADLSYSDKRAQILPQLTSCVVYKIYGRQVLPRVPDLPEKVLPEEHKVSFLIYRCLILYFYPFLELIIALWYMLFFLLIIGLIPDHANPKPGIRVIQSIGFIDFEPIR